MQVLQRPDWHGSPVELAELFRLTKGSNHRSVFCLIHSQQFGFELRLLLGSKADFLRSRRGDADVLTTGEQWKAQLVEGMAVTR